MSRLGELPRLYRDLAEWWPILSAPEDYAEEAGFFHRALVEACRVPPRTLLELGSGGGNNASHLKAHFDMTLVDLSPGMLDVSRALNPECEHVLGDMRTVRLGRRFNAVFVHDAVAYMMTRENLRRAVETAFAHCRPGGAALFAPDHTRETFKPSTSHGGHDRGPRSMRYLEWTVAGPPEGTTYRSTMVYVLRESGKPVRCVLDEHVCGLFARDDWLAILAGAGFEPRIVPFVHSETEPGSREVFLALRPVGDPGA